MNGTKLAHSALAAVALLAAACSDEPSLFRGRGDGGADAGRDASTRRSDASAGSTGSSSGPGAGCKNLQCQQLACDNGVSTSVSGTVFDPAGRNPLYNVAVFVPNTKPDAFDAGASCDACNDLYTGSPIAATLTDAAGKFKLDNVPVGASVPLVIQVGKWRRQLTIAEVSACQDNPQPNGTLRLPRNRGEGDIPNIAVSTGGADTLECLLRRVGVDADEYVPGDDGAGRVHIFQGSRGSDDPPATNTSPAAPSSQVALWNTAEHLLRYDVLLLSCEGDETANMNQQALHDYASAGGRVFASHFHYAWFNSGPYGNENLASWFAGSNEIGNVQGSIVTTLPSGAPFTKGQALASWLANVGALRNGKLPITDAKRNAEVSAQNPHSQSWIVAEPGLFSQGGTQYFSFNTPTDALDNVGDTAASYCGRVVFSDLHVGAASRDNRDRPVPAGCADAPLSPQEAALEFMLFDLSSCIVPDQAMPEPPTLI
ncbi:MAG TPA: carboxypeptidase regulatory-like domain-containing protein [Polyangiales bacterium]|nr:carboxypeptidase regulatory-like domain-containing protein [Polyangiales bacterium]